MDPGITFTGNLAALIPLALASAFMPTRTLLTARMMLTDRPVANPIAFIAGNWVWRLALGGVVLWTLGFDAAGIATVADRTVRAIAGIMSLVFAVLAVAQWRFGARFNQERLDNWWRRLDGFGPGKVFAGTLAVMWLPGAQWLFVLAGCGVIHASDVAPPLEALALMLFTAGQLVMVASPVLATRRALSHAEEIRQSADRLRTRATEKGFMLSAVLSVVFALIALGSLLTR
ncbi:MAG: GAP family protein [Coriobacteriia bacterium]